nr:alpha/beta hydrolase [uncultured Treponema sp.]
MKKKYVALLACIVCMITVATAEEKAKSKARLYDAGVAGVTTYAFDGFDFEGYKASKHGLDNIIRAEHKSIKDVEEEDPDKKGKFAVVGHSQGGLRALAFATYLQNNDAARLNNLQAVVTVSGIDQGLKALDGGLPAANAKIRRDVEILTDGAYGVLNALPAVDILLSALKSFAGFDARQFNKFGWWLINLILDKHPGLSQWVKPALQATTAAAEQDTLNKYCEIRDMIPRSNFIQQNVIESEPYSYQVQTGTTRHLGWKRVTNRWGWKYWALRWQYSPVYSTYIGYKHTSKLPENIPIGYIAGTKNNVLSIAGSKEQDIRNGLKWGGYIFAIAEGFHIAKCVRIVGLFTGSPRYAAACVKAREYCWNFDSRVNNLLGSSEHDGLVAKESQYIPKTAHKKVLGRTTQGYTTFNYNHAEIFNYNGTKMPPPDVQSKITQMIKDGKDSRY